MFCNWAQLDKYNDVIFIWRDTHLFEKLRTNTKKKEKSHSPLLYPLISENRYSLRRIDLWKTILKKVFKIFLSLYFKSKCVSSLWFLKGGALNVIRPQTWGSLLEHVVEPRWTTQQEKNNQEQAVHFIKVNTTTKNAFYSGVFKKCCYRLIYSLVLRDL